MAKYFLSGMVALYLVQICSSGRAKMLSELIENLLSESKGYNPRIRPGLDSGRPLEVYVNMFVQEISSVSEVNMEYSMTAYLRQIWKDERLSYIHTNYNKNITLNYNQFSNIWAPDLFIRNLKRGMFHDMTVPNRLIRLSPDGMILYSQRVSLTMSCDMILHKYPMDNQTCEIDFGSYGYTTDEMTLEWKHVEKPVEVNPKISLPTFRLLAVDSTMCDANFNTTGSYPCIKVYFHFERRLKSYFLHNYLPSLLVVILSWVSFWIDLDAVPARISLGILTILTISTQSGEVNRKMPSVSLTKAIDVWMASCLVFVFAAFIEYSVVNVLSRRHKTLLKRMRQQQTLSQPITLHEPATSVHNGRSARYRLTPTGPPDSKDPEDPAKEGCRSNRYQSDTVSVWCHRLTKNKALMVDMISRVLFPLTFVIFNAFYWPMYYEKLPST